MKTDIAKQGNQVCVNGARLDPRLDLANKSPTGGGMGTAGHLNSPWRSWRTIPGMMPERCAAFRISSEPLSPLLPRKGSP